MIGLLNADMFGRPTEPGEHIDWSKPDYFTPEEFTDVFGVTPEEFAATDSHMIVFLA